MQQEGCWIEPLEVKVIGPHDSVARDLLALRKGRKAPTPFWFRGSRLGDLAIEEAFVYPPIANGQKAD
jgi:hypothetical protein